jgi:hypothetical protein
MLARSWFQIGHYQWLDDKVSGLPTIVILKGLCHQRLMTGLFRFIDKFCTTLWGGLQRIFNQISHILVKAVINLGIKPLAKAGFKIIMRLRRWLILA